MKHALIIITGVHDEEGQDVSVADVRGYGKPLARIIELFKPHVDAVAVATSGRHASVTQKTAANVCRGWQTPLFSHTTPDEQTGTAGAVYRALMKVRIAKKVTIVRGGTVFRSPLPVEGLRQDTMLVDREAQTGTHRLMLERDVVFGMTYRGGEGAYVGVTTLSEKSWRRYVRFYRSLNEPQKLTWAFEEVMSSYVDTTDEQVGLIRAHEVQPGMVEIIERMPDQLAFEARIEVDGGWQCG